MVFVPDVLFPRPEMAQILAAETLGSLCVFEDEEFSHHK